MSGARISRPKRAFLARGTNHTLGIRTAALDPNRTFSVLGTVAETLPAAGMTHLWSNYPLPAIQSAMPDDQRIRFRIGINLGVRMIDITVGGAAAQTAILFPRHELVREVKPGDRVQPCRT